MQCLWKFVEDLFTYQKASFKNFCDLQFSHKLRSSDFCFGGLLHVLCMDWEVKIDMSGQSNSCLRVCNVKMKNFLPERKWGTSPRMYGLRGCSIDRFEFSFMGFGVPISLTVVDIFQPISTRSRWGTWMHNAHGCIDAYLG